MSFPLAEATPMDQPPVILPVQQQPSRVPLWLVAAANAIVLLITIPFYFVPIGARLRPMSWAMWVLMLAAVGVLGFILVLPTLRRYRRLRWPWLVVVLGFAPYPLAMAIIHHAEHVRRFILEP